MPLNKPTISHQLKSIKTQKPKTAIIHTIPNIVPFSPQNRSHLISSNTQTKLSSYNRVNGNLIDSSNLSNADLKQCTKLLRNVLCSEVLTLQQLAQLKKNKSTSTDDFNCQRVISARSVAFKSPDLSSGADKQNNTVNQKENIEVFDDRTDAESLTSNPDHKSANVHNNSQQKSIHSQSISNQILYCNCQSTNNQPMHDYRHPHASGDSSRINDKLPVCTRCHNVIPSSKVSSQDKDTYDGMHKGCNEEFTPGKLPDSHCYTGHIDYKSPNQYNDTPGEKTEDFMSYLHIRINELQSIARLTRDADLGRIVCEIERTFQQMIRENTFVSNHLKTIAKTLKWENSSLKQKIKNQTESNRDLKSELKLIRQEQKQKIEELKLEVQLKSEEIRQLSDREKNSNIQLKDKYSILEKEYEKLRSEYQGQILQACHKDTDIIQLKHSCSQTEAKLKDEIHSLTLANQNLKQECHVTQTQCRKYEQELNHNQLIIKAAREQVVNLLDRHKQNRVDNNSCSYRFEPSCETSVSGEWINQATNLQHVLSMATDNKEKQVTPVKENFHYLTSSTISSSNRFSPHQPQSDQSNLTNSSMKLFASTNYNNNYVSSSSYNHIISDSTNRGSDFERGLLKPQSNFLDICDRSQSPSNMSSTLSDHSFNISGAIHAHNASKTDNIQPIQINGKHCCDSSSSDLNDDPWLLPQPKHFQKMSSASSMMSTVSSLRSTDDREFRNGLKRLDSQISRLQNTLQTNLQCK